ncbi:RNase adapter RapZ [Corynebacterium sp. 153RC1]|uniref:RNase adapter RapZ n=1 Tax=unclassified Corynebacterium TaxID=2624378 RepID=UPI00211CA7EE|nr:MULTISPECIES: RNase adapter RapZ [unclassified Corynebacterium]MCQ9369710.1 RNase adapter RapZ [Corynebacterium sp. 35RC1]MCQ9351442.1 RNase adapter RapZ [Corynebacterium sp. 209RC1]MCQ9354571.1 RNase adapter RapZ [Corynebacterium sp. 1222RC1]MCQ9357372.1 RNase adapter RapZ [Corynebacterium sp. 122RC1]MCQ9357969.1 RNase adapter RapZ [Corynebacterium sp. 142RC1]
MSAHAEELTNGQGQDQAQIPPILITGLSGAGLSSAGRVLEDMGWFVAQNIPAVMVTELVEMARTATSPVERIAVVSDVRSLAFAGNLEQVISTLASKGNQPLVLFMDARDDVLIKRFDNVRRTHPLQGNGTLLVGIEREREIMSTLRENADVIIDTSDLSVHDLRRAIESNFSSIATKAPHVTIQSFGFKHGSPRDTDIMLDVRFLPNPFWVPELRPFRGVDKPVSDYVLSQEHTEEFLNNFIAMFDNMRSGFIHEGKNFITVSVGCTGGHHRSVAIAEEIGARLRERGDLDVTVNHRDISRN